MIRFRLVLYQIAGILALAWMLAASNHAYAATHRAAAVGPTERCTAHALVTNRISTHEARRLRIGRHVRIASNIIALKKGDNIWKLCRFLAKHASATAAPAPRIEPEVLTQLTQVKENVSALDKELIGTKAQLASTQDQLITISSRVAAAGEELIKATAALNAATAARATAARADLTGRETALVRTVYILCGVTILALCALAAWIAYVATERRRTERVSTQQQANIAQALVDAQTQIHKQLDLLRRSSELLMLKPVRYTISPGALEEEVPPERRTFSIILTDLSRREDKYTLHCVLPWGEGSIYEPRELQRELQSNTARAYYATQNGIHVRKEVDSGRKLLATPLPDFESVFSELERSLLESRTRLMSAAE